MTAPRVNELAISVDIETDGPIPGGFNILSIGACVVGHYRKDESFYRELAPISPRYDLNTVAFLKTQGIERSHFVENGQSALTATKGFDAWIHHWLYELGNDKKPIFVGLNAAFDWQFINWYFHQFLDGNPFGYKPLDICAYFMGKFGVAKLKDTGDTSIRQYLKLPEVPKTHHALEDAIDQGKLFEAILDYRKE